MPHQRHHPLLCHSGDSARGQQPPIIACGHPIPAIANREILSICPALGSTRVLQDGSPHNRDSWRAAAMAFAVTVPTATPPIRPGPAVAAKASISASVSPFCKARLQSQHQSFKMRTCGYFWHHAAIFSMLGHLRGYFIGVDVLSLPMIAAAVSSQLLSMPSMI